MNSFSGLVHTARHTNYSEYLELDLSTVVPSIAGPKRPQDRILLSESKKVFNETLPTYSPEGIREVPLTMADGTETRLRDGDVTITSITSCTNTSNPSVMMAAGLLAKAAVEKGLTSKPWVKTLL